MKSQNLRDLEKTEEKDNVGKENYVTGVEVRVENAEDDSVQHW